MDNLFEVELSNFVKLCRGSIYFNNHVVSGKEYDCVFLVETHKDMRALSDPFLMNKRTLVIRDEDFLKGQLINAK